MSFEEGSITQTAWKAAEKDDDPRPPDPAPCDQAVAPDASSAQSARASNAGELALVNPTPLTLKHRDAPPLLLALTFDPLANLAAPPVAFPPMRFLSLAALKVALADLFDKRHPALILSNAGKTYEPILLEKKNLIDALPAVLTGSKPLVEEIDAADELHDGYGAALWHLGQAYLRCPNVAPEVRAAAKRIVDAFIPELDDLNASFVDEAHAAIQHKQDLQTREADLKSIPIAGGFTSLDWAQGYVAGGELVGTLLSQRADADTGARKEAAKIRASTIAVLGRFRGALGDEVGVNAALPKDLDGQVFGYFDELGAMRAAVVAAKPKKGAPPGPPPPQNPPAGPPAGGGP